MGRDVVWCDPQSFQNITNCPQMYNIFPGQAEHWNWTEAFEVSICRSICRTLGKTLGHGADNQDWTVPVGLVRIFQIATVTRVSIGRVHTWINYQRARDPCGKFLTEAISMMQMTTIRRSPSSLSGFSKLSLIIIIIIILSDSWLLCRQPRACQDFPNYRKLLQPTAARIGTNTRPLIKYETLKRDEKGVGYWKGIFLTVQHCHMWCL